MNWDPKDIFLDRTYLRPEPNEVPTVVLELLDPKIFWFTAASFPVLPRQEFSVCSPQWQVQLKSQLHWLPSNVWLLDKTGSRLTASSSRNWPKSDCWLVLIFPPDCVSVVCWWCVRPVCWGWMLCNCCGMHKCSHVLHPAGPPTHTPSWAWRSMNLCLPRHAANSRTATHIHIDS